MGDRRGAAVEGTGAMMEWLGRLLKRHAPPSTRTDESSGLIEELRRHGERAERQTVARRRRREAHPADALLAARRDHPLEERNGR